MAGQCSAQDFLKTKAEASSNTNSENMACDARSHSCNGISSEHIFVKGYSTCMARYAWAQNCLGSQRERKRLDACNTCPDCSKRFERALMPSGSYLEEVGLMGREVSRMPLASA